MRLVFAFMACSASTMGVARPARISDHRFPEVLAGKSAGGSSAGRLPDQAAWRAAPIIILAQQNPHPGAPTAFATTVRILRDGRHIYLGIECIDPDPSRIAVHTMQRDGDQSGDDNVTVVLDPFAEKKLAYVFQVNASGAMADGLISPGYLNPNTNSLVDYTWNGYWTAVVKRTATGWTAEIAIDSQSLQFDSE